MAMKVKPGSHAQPMFALGQLTATPSALSYLDQLDVQPINLIQRHVTGDWGDLSEADKTANHQSLVEGTRILSAYVLEGTKLYVITEHDRSITTLLLASEYYRYGTIKYELSSDS